MNEQECSHFRAWAFNEFRSRAAFHVACDAVFTYPGLRDDLDACLPWSQITSHALNHKYQGVDEVNAAMDVVEAKLARVA